jgi:hypothetical protein
MELSDNQLRLLNEIREQCARRGWFSVNARDLQELNDMMFLEKNGFVEIEERDVRIDQISKRIKAGELVGKLLPVD